MLAFWFHLNLQRSEKLILRTDDFTFSFLLATFENFLVVIKEYFLVDKILVKDFLAEQQQLDKGKMKLSWPTTLGSQRMGNRNNQPQTNDRKLHALHQRLLAPNKYCVCWPKFEINVTGSTLRLYGWQI